MSWDVGSWVIDTVNSVLGTLIQAHGTQTFTSNGTFTVPAGVTKILITACGGGASCNQGSSSNQAAGGQGGACIFKKAFKVTPGQKIPITIGRGGIYESTIGGVAGNPTVVGNLVTLPGGARGNTPYASVPSRTHVDGGGIGGWGGVANAGSFGSDGLIGKGGNTTTSSEKNHGGGGGSLGDGAVPGDLSYTDCYGIPAGYGGGGAYTPYGGTEQEKVRNGGDGIVIIEW